MAALPKCLVEVADANGQIKPEGVSGINGHKMPIVFAYAMTCEKIFEANLAEVKPEEKRRYTWAHDLSIGEWCEGVAGVVSTCKNALLYNINDAKCMAEFLLSVNWKSWEHAARENWVWVKVYKALYYALLDLVYEYYENDADGAAYIWQYLD